MSGCNFIILPVPVPYVAEYHFASHDEIAEMLGVSAPPFQTHHKEEVREMQRLVSNYVRTLHGSLVGTTIPATGNGSMPNGPLLTLHSTGYPKLPSGFQANDY